MKRLLTVFLVMISTLSYGQGSFDIGIGLGKSVLNDFVFFNPKQTYLTRTFISDKSSNLGLSAALNYRIIKQSFRFDFGLQINKEQYDFEPILAEKEVHEITSVSSITSNFVFVINYTKYNFAIGAGPNIKYAFRPRFESIGGVQTNVKVKSLYSLGLKLNIDYKFKIVNRGFVLGYNFDLFRKRSPQLETQLFYGQSPSDIFIHQLPLNHQSLKLSYVF